MTSQNITINKNIHQPHQSDLEISPFRHIYLWVVDKCRQQLPQSRGNENKQDILKPLILKQINETLLEPIKTCAKELLAEEIPTRVRLKYKSPYKSAFSLYRQPILFVEICFRHCIENSYTDIAKQINNKYSGYRLTPALIDNVLYFFFHIPTGSDADHYEVLRLYKYLEDHRHLNPWLARVFSLLTGQIPLYEIECWLGQKLDTDAMSRMLGNAFRFCLGRYWELISQDRTEDAGVYLDQTYKLAQITAISKLDLQQSDLTDLYIPHLVDHTT